MADATVASDSTELKEGQQVMLEGLVREPRLNGRFGQVVGLLPDQNGRYAVRLFERPGSTAKTLALLRSNLTHMPTPRNASEAMECRAHIRSCSCCGNIFGKIYMMKCASCKWTEYCSKECQSSHWPEHKKNCKIVKAGRKEKDSELPSIQRPHERANARMARSIQFLRSGNPAAAETELRQIIEEFDPQIHYVYAQLAGALIMQNRLNEGIAAFRQALQMPLNDDETPAAYAASHLMLGTLLQGKKDIEGARDAYRAVLEINPESEEAAEKLRKLPC